MRFPYSLSTIANAIWSLVPLASRTVTVGADTITAAAIAADAIGASELAADAIGASEFSQAAADKVWATAARTLTGGVTVTAGSYSVRASSTQHVTGTIANTASTGSITLPGSVTTTRAVFAATGTSGPSAVSNALQGYGVLTGATTISLTRGGTTDEYTYAFSVVEFF